MRRTDFRLLALAASLSALAALAACGGGGGSGSPPVSNPGPSTSSAPTATPGPKPTVGTTPAPGWTDEVFVANSAGNSVTIYRARSNGNASPGATISGGNPLLAAPQGIAVDAACNVYVSTQNGTPAIDVFGGALGNVAPIRTVANAGGGLYADRAHGVLLAADFSGVQAFALGVNVSNTAQYGISGPPLVTPSAVAADSGGNVYVADNSGQQIVVYPMGGGSPLFSIAGSNTGLAQPSGVALDGQNDVYVANAGSNDVTMYARGLQGNVTPTATIVPPGGTATGVAVDAAGYVFVSTSAPGGGAIYVYAPSAFATPISTISGSLTGLDGPAAVGLTPAPSCY